MLALFEKTWVLWWMLAVVVIVRWFHVLSAAAPGILPNRLTMTATNTPCPVSWLPEREVS